MKILKSLAILLGVISLATFSTHSYFTSQASVEGNQFSTGSWETPTPTPSGTIEPTPTPSPTPTPQARIVINEVYYDVDASHGTETNDEWVEIYNAGNDTANLQNWTITDNSATRTINAASHILAPGQFALISKDHSTWSLYWSVPAGVEIIELGLNIGNGLSNTGDRLILQDNLGNIVDQISYGTDISILDPSIPDVTEGHSIERNPAGTDTDTAADFIDRATPTPGS